MSDHLTSELDRIAERDQAVFDKRGHVGGLLAINEAKDDTPRLLAALRAVLELHQPGPIGIFGALCERHENHRYFSITRTEADDVRACPDCEATVYTLCTGCGPQASMEACPVRLAITREITGGTDG